jgi:hypothetical protein
MKARYREPCIEQPLPESKGTKRKRINYYMTDRIVRIFRRYAKAGEYHSRGPHVRYMDSASIDCQYRKQSDVAQSSFEAEL